MPVDGEILAFNKELENAPELVNEDPYGKGWIVKIRVTNPSQYDTLLTATDYKNLIS